MQILLDLNFCVFSSRTNFPQRVLPSIFWSFSSKNSSNLFFNINYETMEEALSVIQSRFFPKFFNCFQEDVWENIFRKAFVRNKHAYIHIKVSQLQRHFLIFLINSTIFLLFLNFLRREYMSGSLLKSGTWVYKIRVVIFIFVIFGFFFFFGKANFAFLLLLQFLPGNTGKLESTLDVRVRRTTWDRI